MNKLIIDTNKFTSGLNEDLYLDIKCSSDINLNIIDKKINLIILTHDTDINLNIIVNQNSTLEINCLGINASLNYNITLKDNTNLFVVDSILTKTNSINNIDIKHCGSNINTYFYTNGINLENNKLYFNLNGIIPKDSLNTNIFENSKIINLREGDSKIIPNLIIDTKETSANHSAFIGTFNNDELYYLASRGINLLDAKRLLIKSYLLTNMKLNIEDFIKEITLNID